MSGREPPWPEPTQVLKRDRGIYGMTVIPAIPGWRYALLDTEQGSDFYTAEIVAWWVNGHELEPFILDYLRTTVRLLNDRDDPVAILPPGEEIDGGHFDQAAVLWEIKRKEEERT